MFGWIISNNKNVSVIVCDLQGAEFWVSYHVYIFAELGMLTSFSNKLFQLSRSLYIHFLTFNAALILHLIQVLFVQQIEIIQELYDTIRNHKTEDGRLLCETFIRVPKRRQDSDINFFSFFYSY